MHAVRTPHADRGPVLERAPADRLESALDPLDEQRSGLADLEGQSRVDDVRGREAVVEPATVRAERLRDGVDEGCGVVVKRGLELGHTLWRRRFRPLNDRTRRFQPDGAELAARP